MSTEEDFRANLVKFGVPEQFHDDIVGVLGEGLAALDKRVAELEASTPEQRQLQYEADLAAADLAASGYDEYAPIGADRHGPGCLCPYCPPGDDEDGPGVIS